MNFIESPIQNNKHHGVEMLIKGGKNIKNFNAAQLITYTEKSVGIKSERHRDSARNLLQEGFSNALHQEDHQSSNGAISEKIEGETSTPSS
jgi:hypothetical protein